MGMNWEGLYNGGDPPNIRGGIGKILGEKILNEIYCSTVKNKLYEIANSSKNLLLGLIFDP